ncbi:signal peptidase I [Geochorda subterranea]|uniref:Signal peptidase I n=1 Tax=Geochorda subterranea TaxID=3109564 RepID=A0ABZ1BPR6_9FIRM|nr:signal peptidase I [Limnochorda sp. LNt]WRP14092.1 signal peptidase I [Limnochorda sp. LNt]
MGSAPTPRGVRPAGRRRSTPGAAQPGRAIGAAVVELLKTVAGAAILALLIMTFVARAFTVEGNSMLPTLHDGERLMVDKLTYRFHEPQRGDIVVFRYPLDPREHYIKRIVGVPGDEVAVRNGRVFVNGTPLDESYLASPTLGRFGPVRVPEGHYFVLGDNRNNSEDSRDPRLGFIPRELIEGRAIWRYWPLARMSVIARPSVFSRLPAPAAGAQAAPAVP